MSFKYGSLEENFWSTVKYIDSWPPMRWVYITPHNVTSLNTLSAAVKMKMLRQKWILIFSQNRGEIEREEQ